VLAPSNAGLRLIVHAVEPLFFPVAEKLSSAGLLLKDPKTWAGKYVEIEEIWTRGFEGSFLDLEHTHVARRFYSTVTRRCEPAPRSVRLSPYATETFRVRVKGYAYTDGRCGHGGRSKAMILVTDVLFVDPSLPGCL
jgi:hypothetical protein